MAETDFLSQSFAQPSAYSRAFAYPYLNAEYQPLDPAALEIHHCLTVMLSLDGAAYSGSYTIGASDDVASALAGVAVVLDRAVMPDFHVFSRGNTIAVQASAGHTAALRSITVSPYRAPAASWAMLTVDPPLGATKAVVVVTRGGVAQTFASAPNPAALAAVLTASPWLVAEQVSETAIRISASSGVSLVVGPVSYE